MATQNCINTGFIATNSEVIQGTDTRKLVVPSSLDSALNLGRNQAPGSFENLSLSYSAGVLSVVGANGSPLSATNPGYICLPSKVFPGRIVRHKLVAPTTLTLADMTNCLMGTTNVVAWGSALPFYIYVTASDADANPEFSVCRVPHRNVSPSVADSGCPGTLTADAEQSFFYFNAVTLSDYDGNPTASFGCFQVVKDGSNAWSLTGLTSNEGFGLFNESVRFEFPSGQGGAASGKYLLTNGGTAPTFTNTPRYHYYINRGGLIEISCFLSNTAGGTPGAGAVEAQLTMPFSLINGDLCICRLIGSSTLYSSLIPNAASPYAVFNDITAPGTGSQDLALFSTAVRTISFGLTTQLPIL